MKYSSVRENVLNLGLPPCRAAEFVSTFLPVLRYSKCVVPCAIFVLYQQPVGGTSSIFMGEDPTEPIARRASSAKVNALLGTGEYREEPPALHASQTKMKEMQGCNIFADGKPQIRDSLGGVREPPGGKSSVALI